MAEVGYVLDEDLNFEALVIGDEASGDVIEVQRSLTFDDQDRVFGMDMYCLVRGGATYYGGIEHWSVAGGSLSIQLLPEAAASLDLPTILSIAVTPPGEAILVHLERLLR